VCKEALISATREGGSVHLLEKCTLREGQNLHPLQDSLWGLFNDGPHQKTASLHDGHGRVLEELEELPPEVGDKFLKKNKKNNKK